MVNTVILIGNVGKDPEVRYLDNGTALASFTLATNETYKDKEGNRQSKTTWHNIILWRGVAEVAEKYVKKGMPLYIQGKITYKEYEKDGQKKYMTQIVGNEMKMLGGKDSNNPHEASAGSKPDVSNESFDNSDLPF
jgi:single-strand DNA-binding protein